MGDHSKKKEGTKCRLRTQPMNGRGTEKQKPASDRYQTVQERKSLIRNAPRADNDLREVFEKRVRHKEDRDNLRRRG